MSKKKREAEIDLILLLPNITVIIAFGASLFSIIKLWPDATVHSYATTAEERTNIPQRVNPHKKT